MRLSRRKKSLSLGGGDNAMMSRFTDKAQEALQRAQQIMFARHNTMLDVEHLFLALLNRPDELPSQILTLLGGNVGSMAHQLETALNKISSYKQGSEATTGYITFRCNRVLQRSLEEANLLNDNYISLEHLLLAISTEPQGVASRILYEAKIGHEKIFKEVLKYRQDGLAGKPSVELSPDDLGLHAQIINPPLLPEPRGFNHGILTTGGRTLYLAGQTALDAEGKIVAPGDIVAQYRQVLSNLQAVVHAAGGVMQNMVKMTIYVSDRDGYKARLKELGEVHKDFFGAYYPAMALLEISRFFDDDAMLEIEGIAILP